MNSQTKSNLPSLAGASNDAEDDSSHGLFAFQKIKENLSFKPNKNSLISNGTASNFKNRFILYEL